ncbi:Reverse transcriptase (RNA-dependent DNA polymerase) [Rhizoctonia solani]|uniref:Reverse transcriptase (RNA-dependent DNA polymerase) n=1 Tax=Rhizoctonia solani TaxID=456999 RepID=A0A8H7M107_9AGAM|nr:Reverse transcriptase (RNA-dependent DNA polymerase) [Rhizoctonia solani]
MPHSGTCLDTAESACKINANPSLKSSGVQTCCQNPNKPKLTLDTNYGGVKITVKDTAAAPTRGTMDPGLHPNRTLPTASRISWRPSQTTTRTGFLPPTFQTSNNPTTEEALLGPDADKWKAAMEQEIATLEKQGTYNTSTLPPGRKAMGCQWVLTIKQNKEGQPIQYKAQLVVQGYSQQPGIDYGQTFAPVVRLDSIRTLTSLANQNDWDIQQLDITLAYLHANVKEELYMRQIPYFDTDPATFCAYANHYTALNKPDACGIVYACVYHQIMDISGKLYVSLLPSMLMTQS